MAEYLQVPDPIDPEARPVSPSDLRPSVDDVYAFDPTGERLAQAKIDEEATLKHEEEQADLARKADLERFMLMIREWFRESADATDAVRQRMVADLRFASGGDEQWIVGGSNFAEIRRKSGRPVHTVNRIPGFVKQVTNAIREARTGIEYIPVDDEADQETAEVLQGLARHVEQNSMADIAYETAMEHQVRAGLGWFYARTDFVDDGSDEQDILIERVRNPLTIYWDPACQRWDFSDARYLFRVEDLPLETYRRLYGQDAPIASLEEFTSTGAHASYWRFKDRIRVAEVYYIEHVPRQLVALADPGGGEPTKHFLDEIPQEVLSAAAQMNAVAPVRTVSVPVVMWAKVNGIGVIDGNKDKTAGRRIPGRWIPFAPVIGDEQDINGDVDYRGMVRDLRDAQMMVNFWQSAITEAIALAPRAPYIVSAGQLGDFKDIWDNANTASFAYLPYETEDVAGHLVPPPQRNVMEPAIQAMVLALQIAENHLRALAGFYDVEPRERKQEQSGRAILARQQQGERGNGHFHGNLSRAIRHMGRILLAQFPEVYDTARVKRIIGADENERNVVVYSGEENKPQQPVVPKGRQEPLRQFDLSVGRYDVRTTVGPSYPTRRQEGLDKLTELAKVNPLVGQAGADLIVGMVDSPGSRELSQRLKKMPQIAQLISQDEGDPQTKIVQLQAQMSQMGQLLELQTKELNAKNAFIETEGAKFEAQERIKRLEIASREAIAFQSAQIELARLRSTVDMTAFQAQLSSIETALTQAFEHSHAEHVREIDATREREQAALEQAVQSQGGGPAGPGGMVAPGPEGSAQ